MSACAPSDRIKQSTIVRVPGLTDALFSVELFNVMDEFFKRTSAWREKADIVIDPSATEYALPIPADAAFVRMMSVNLGDTPVPSSSQASGVSQSAFGVLNPELTFPDGDSQFQPTASDLSGVLFSYAIFSPDFITFTTPPSVEQAKNPLSVVMALTIAAPCCGKDCGDWLLADWMYDMFYQDWLDGVLGRLFMMPAKPWSSPTLAAYHGKRFRQAMGYRKQEANRGFVYEVPGFRFPRQGGWV